MPVTPRGAGTGMTGGALPVARRHRAVDRADDDASSRSSRTIASRSSSPASSPATCTRRSRRRACSTRPIRLPGVLHARRQRRRERGRAARLQVRRHARVRARPRAWLMGGETLRIGRRTVKGVTGYDVTALFVGSEGTLGVTTEITLRLVAEAARRSATLLALMPDAVAAGRAVSAIMRTGSCRAASSCSTRRPRAVRPQAPSIVPGATRRDAARRGRRRARGDGGGVAALRRRAARPRARSTCSWRATTPQRERLWEARRQCSRSLREAHASRSRRTSSCRRTAIVDCSRGRRHRRDAHGMRCSPTATPATATCT